MKTFAKWVARILVLLTLVLLSIPHFIYSYGVRHVTHLYDSPETIQSEFILSEYKRWLGRNEDYEYQKLNAYTYIFYFLNSVRNRDSNPDIRSDVKLYLNAARIRFFTRVKGYNSAEIIGTIYVSRHWSVDQIISEVLTRQYYGNRIYEFEAASEYYFGVPSTELTADQLFALFHIPQSPSSFDLWCEMGRFKRSLETKLLRRDIEYDLPPLVLRANPEKVC